MSSFALKPKFYPILILRKTVLHQIKYIVDHIGFNCKGCAKWNVGFRKYSEPPKGVLGAAPEAIQSYLQPKTRLK